MSSAYDVIAIGGGSAGTAEGGPSKPPIFDLNPRVRNSWVMTRQTEVAERRCM
jgi:hypothetical protein